MLSKPSFFAALFCLFFIHCTPKMNPTPSGNDSVKMLALGDSYTIGEAVPETQRFAYHTQQLLQNRFPQKTFAPITYVATTGWTCEELESAINQRSFSPPYQLVTLLIGVNDQFRNYPIQEYPPRFLRLLQKAIEFAGGNVGRVQVLSIPDYGVTPFAANRNPPKIAAEIDAYNRLADSVCRTRNVAFTNITPISREGAANAALNASDGLHPSGIQYQRWAQLLAPRIVL